MAEETESNDARTHEWITEAEHAGTRLDHFLAERLADFSRAQLRRWIDAGKVTIDGKIASKSGIKLRNKQTVYAEAVPLPPNRAIPQDIPIQVVYEDEFLVVVNKTPGMVVHPAAGHPEGTLVNALLHHCGSLSDAGDPFRPGLVHRLDKDTSGVMVVAKSDRAHKHLSEQIQSREASRRYLAVVLGTQVPEDGSFDTSYGRHPTHRLKFSSVHNGSRRAVTHYRVLARSHMTSLMALKLETGRTHQIRVHFADARFPVVNDAVYGRPIDRRKRGLHHAEAKVVEAMPRMALHAASLSLTHPGTGERMHLTARLPDDMAALAKGLYGDGGEDVLETVYNGWSTSAADAPKP